MKAALALALAAASAAAMAQAPQGAEASTAVPALRVLFLGNSYTHNNGMPSLLPAFAAAARLQRPIEIREVTMDGATLEGLWAMRQTRYALTDERWDFVVLQEQSLRPLQNPDRMAAAVTEIDAAVRQAGARTVLLLTWPRRDQPEMQEPITRAYASLAERLGAVLAPVGPAWALALAADPALPLYARDGSHPSRTGSYLTACVVLLAIESGLKACPRLAAAGVKPEHAQRVGAAASRALARSPAGKAR